MKHALLLNADWTPLNFVSDTRALRLLYKGRAEVINFDDSPSEWEEYIASTTSKYKIPATIRLLTRVQRKWKAPRFRKWVLFNRDDWQRQYCGTGLDWRTATIDHVHPRCRGGLTTWKNCVTSCIRCNHKKGSKHLSESGLLLKKRPAEPQPNHFWDIRKTSSLWHPDWGAFLDR